MIERVARAICKSLGFDPDEDWGDGSGGMWLEYKKPAQAAIAAMWVPFDLEDEGTWPETDRVLLHMGLASVPYSAEGYYRIDGNAGWVTCMDPDVPTPYIRPTHYQEITEP